MPQLTIIADDLTGAADTGSSFAEAGFATAIPLASRSSGSLDVVSISTESRDLDPVAAAAAFRSAVEWAIADTPRWFYKKIDSALRGHPRDELLALMAATHASRAIVAPAIPSQGRTTAGGRQRIDGAPLEMSHLDGDGATSDLKVLFANDHGIPVHPLGLDAIRRGPGAIQAAIASLAPGIVIADAETDQDLAALALAAARIDLRLLCGAAGFAAQLARTLPLVPSEPRMTIQRIRPAPVLAVAGSQHAATARQAASAERAGAAIVLVSQRCIDYPTTSIAALTEAIAERLDAGVHVIVTTAGLRPSPHGQHVVAERLAAIANAPIVRNRVGGLVLTGGDVAAKTCSALGATAFRLAGDVRPGLPWGRLDGGALPGAPIATKAGSFGDDDALVACIEHLARLPVAGSR